MVEINPESATTTCLIIISWFWPEKKTPEFINVIIKEGKRKESKVDKEMGHTEILVNQRYLPIRDVGTCILQ